MGRLILLISVLSLPAILTGCAPSPQPAGAGHTNDPHAQLTCASCHEYTLANQTQRAVDRLVSPDSMSRHAPVPLETCTSAGCHPDRGPREVEFRSLSFEHRQHGGDSVVAMGCVGCHTHDRGGEPLIAALDPCSLCHLGDQSAGNQGECRQCHTSLDHVSATSQGLSVPHRDLPWVDGGCVRCHYDVTRARLEVAVTSCRMCHTDEDEMVARGIGEDLHGSHVSVGCLSCHEGEAHRIRAMSSVVQLVCAQCHQEVHRVETSPEWPEANLCNECHQGAHLEQQEMVLGLVPQLAGATPSVKFQAGLTCASCHQSSLNTDPTVPVGAPPAGCQGCHLDEYATVLVWWQEGAQVRIDRVKTVLASGTGQIEGPPEALSRLDSAAVLMNIVEKGRPEHNLVLAHRLLVRISALVTEAYVRAGRTPPPQPVLGREPSDGLCSYCHYRSNDPWLFEQMSGAFHRQALSIPPRR